MPALGFRPQYAALILAGRKDQTIRAPRKVPIKPGDRLHLFTGMRTKNCRKIGTAVCSEVFHLYLSHHLRTCGTTSTGPFTCEERDALARRDGFANWDELRTVLWNMHPGREAFDVIRWHRFEPAEGAAIPTARLDEVSRG